MNHVEGRAFALSVRYQRECRKSRTVEHRFRRIPRFGLAGRNSRRVCFEVKKPPAGWVNHRNPQIFLLFYLTSTEVYLQYHGSSGTSKAKTKHMPQSKDFISIRLDAALKAELQVAAEMERRSLSNFGRLLLEVAWAQYLKAGSIRALIAMHERQQHSMERSGD